MFNLIFHNTPMSTYNRICLRFTFNLMTFTFAIVGIHFAGGLGFLPVN